MNPAVLATTRRTSYWVSVLLTAVAFVPSLLSAPIKVGIIGFDAHAVPWTQILNKPGAPAQLSNLRIVAAYPAYSPDVPFSADSIQKNIATMRELGVEITSSIDEM